MSITEAGITKSLKRVFWGVIVGVLVVGAAGWVHWQIHSLDAPKIRSQTQIQERRVEQTQTQIETITQKVIIGE